MRSDNCVLRTCLLASVSNERNASSSTLLTDRLEKSEISLHSTTFYFFTSTTMPHVNQIRFFILIILTHEFRFNWTERLNSTLRINYKNPCETRKNRLHSLLLYFCRRMCCRSIVVLKCQLAVVISITRIRFAIHVLFPFLRAFDFDSVDVFNFVGVFLRFWLFRIQNVRR